MGDIYENEVLIPEALENLQLPNPSLLLDYQLGEKRIIYIDYEIDDSILDVQRQIILYNLEDKENNIPIEKRVPIKLLINSPGGLLSETMSLIAVMQMSKTPIWTVNLAAAYSGGAMLLMAGHKRYALPYSKGMIHTGSGGLGGTYEQVTEQSKKYKKEIETMTNFILEHSKIDKKVYGKNKVKDWYMTDEEQLYYGLVDEVVENIFDIL